MSDFAGETIHATNPTSGAQEQGVVAQVFDDGRVLVQFSDGSTTVLQHDQMQTG